MFSISVISAESICPSGTQDPLSKQVVSIMLASMV